MIKGIDPRTKLIIVLCISTIAIIIEDTLDFTVILLITIGIAKSLNINLGKSLKKVKGLIYALFGIIIIQSIFLSEGETIFSLGNLIVLTTGGLTKGLQFFLRMMIVIISATIMTTSNYREIIQGLVQWKLPYDIAFMVAIGIRFLPILKDEIKESLLAIQLRGVEIHNIPIKQRINLFSYLFSPIIVGTILKAERLSMAIEMRGFRAYDSRTSYLQLEMSKLDYIIILISLIVTIGYIIFYFYR